MIFSVISNAWIRYFCSNQSVNKLTIHIHALLMPEKSVRTLRSSDALQNGTTLTQRDREETNCWINVVILIFFAYKKYSRRFIKFRLNHWWQMDYFDYVFYTFLCLDSVIYLAVNGTVTPPGFHPKYHKFCSEDERSFYGFGTIWGGKWLMTKFAFWGGVSL